MSFAKALHDMKLEEKAKAYEKLGQSEKAAECYNNMIYKTNYTVEKINKLTPKIRTSNTPKRTSGFIKRYDF
jgi:hypothetical protein